MGEFLVVILLGWEFRELLFTLLGNLEKLDVPGGGGVWMVK